MAQGPPCRTAGHLGAATGPGRRFGGALRRLHRGEVASTARALGLGVTLVDASPYPMRNVLGTEAARWLAGHHRDNGVELVSETRVTGFNGNGRVTACA
ncbi:FAD-dependent oxidoreductase [Nonomuraea sp. NPDC050202]|uniref:FAD-dependent oxidoreductase n=1 Tax=Nonomuraea sp. NPDC050202 TaxID=3155035 RepID=UPI0033F15659